MSKVTYNKFNRGEVDPDALARLDVDKINNSSELIDNWLPFRLGGMMHRPGLELINMLPISDSVFMVPFQRSLQSRAILMFQDQALRIYDVDADDNVTQVTGNTVTTSITNNTFDSDIAGWTDSSGGSATTDWTADQGGCAELTGTGIEEAVLSQSFSTDVGTEHCLRVVVKEAPVTVQIGYGVGQTEVFEGPLKPGIHQLNFTPNSTLTITFRNDKKYRALIDQVDFITGEVRFDFNYAKFYIWNGINSENLSDLKYSQSGDVLFFAMKDVPQFQIERRGTKSWSLVEYQSNDGPFGTINTTDITIAPQGLTGNVELIASRDYFTEDHVGQLIKVASAGQYRQAAITAQDTGTDSILVTGTGSTRAFTIDVSGTFVATATLQRSVDEVTWEDIATYSGIGTASYNDEIDNGVFFYRLHVKTGDYTSGTMGLFLIYDSGSIEGVARVTSYTSATSVQCQVLESFGRAEASRNWYTGQWNNKDGWPAAVEIFESRLWWAGDSQLWGSVSDAYTSFDRDAEELGNSASIYKTIGFGPSDDVHWLQRGQMLMLGIATDEITVRSSSFGEVLTSTNTNLRSGNNQGSSKVPPERVDKTVFFVHNDRKRLFSLEPINMEQSQTVDQNTLNADICKEGMIRLARTRQPETRIWAAMVDGTARCFLVDLLEEVKSWSRISTEGGLIKDIVSLRGTGGDSVFMAVQRGSYMSLERLAQISQAEGGDISISCDHALVLSSPGDSIDLTPYPALQNRELWVWADGAFLGLINSTTSINVGGVYSNVVIGIEITADCTSNRLNGFQASNPNNERRQVAMIGVIGRNIWYSTFSFSGDGIYYENLPTVERGVDVDPNSLITLYDEPMIPFPGDSLIDSRVRLRATGPAKVLALTYEIDSPGNQPSNSSSSDE